MPCVEVQQEWASRTKLPHHVTLTHAIIVTANVVGLLYFGERFKVSILRTLTILNSCFVRGIVPAYSVVVFEEHTVEDTPTTVTALVHKIALKGELRGQIVLFTVVKHNTGLKHRVGGYDVARTTIKLVSKVTNKIVPFKVFPIKFRWKLVYANFFWVCEIDLGSFEYFVELIRVVVERLRF